MAHSFRSSRFYGFLCELRRRKVDRVAAGYGVVGWLIIQFAVAVFPILTLPAWSSRLVVLIVLGGFPIALVLAWAFDVGAGGIHVTPEPVSDPECPPAFSARRRNIAVLALFGLTISALIGYFLLARGTGRKLDKSVAVLPFAKAVLLDPQNPILLENVGMNYLALRDYPGAARIIGHALAAAPDSFTIRALRARVDFESKGDLRPMQELLASTPEQTDPNGTITLTRYNDKLYERKFDELLQILERSPAQQSRGETSAPIPKSFLTANVYALKKDTAKAQANYEGARLIAERAVQKSPNDGPRHALLGLIYAGLGRCTEATAEGNRVVELLPETKDAFDGPILAFSRARIALACGDQETALALLDRSLATPAGMTVHELRLDPMWDALRNDPRFQQMLAKHGGS